MEFKNNLFQLSQRAEQMRDHLKSEEATKTAIIMPFFSILGYDVFNPREFLPEYTSDFGLKKGEKVDYEAEMVADYEHRELSEDGFNPKHTV